MAASPGTHDRPSPPRASPTIGVGAGDPNSGGNSNSSGWRIDGVMNSGASGERKRKKERSGEETLCRRC